MNRRQILALLAVNGLPLLADPASDAWEVIAAMAAALAEDNASGFMKRIDANLLGYSELGENIKAIVEQSNARSEILPLSNEGTAEKRTLELDWELRLTRKGEDTRSLTREEAVTVELLRGEKSWRVMKLDPISFFAAPAFR